MEVVEASTVEAGDLTAAEDLEEVDSAEAAVTRIAVAGPGAMAATRIEAEVMLGGTAAAIAVRRLDTLAARARTEATDIPTRLGITRRPQIVVTAQMAPAPRLRAGQAVATRAT